MEQAGRAGRLAGLALIVGAAGTVATMAFHPSGAHAGGLAAGVHGLMIAWLMLLTWGFANFAIRRGAARPLILAGLLAYGVSLVGHIAAATINGFVVPALANPAAPAVSHDLFRLLWHSNQAFAKLGVYMTGAAYAFWSLDMLGRRSGPVAIPWLGLVAGGLPAVLLVFGLIRMDVHGALFIYAVQAAWAALIGWQLLHEGKEGPKRVRQISG